ncbi:MAG: TM2 domain-containing protein [Acidihalobacter sp.]
MKKAWKQLDLGGEGLQTLNAQYTRHMRRLPLAYAAMLLFPLGAHRWYLREPYGALAYLALTLAAITGAFTLGTPGFAVPAIAGLLFAAFDLLWVERRVLALNKSLRMRQFMRPGAAPPENYRGRYADADDELEDYVHIKERERAGHQPAASDNQEAPNRRPRTPSFSEQEALLRELARSDKGRKPRDKD